MNQVAAVCRKAFETGGAGKVLAAALGLHDEALAGRFRLGYADDTLLAAIPSPRVGLPGNGAGGDLRGVLKSLGILDQDGRLTISGCLVVPVLDRDCRATGFVAVDEHGGERRFPADLPIGRSFIAYRRRGSSRDQTMSRVTHSRGIDTLRQP